jgi:hypothetical protein
VAKKTTPVKSRKPATRKRVVKKVKSSGRPKWLAPLVVLAIAALGTYLLVNSFAASNNRFADQPNRGLIYSAEKIATHGPCQDMEDEGSVNGIAQCAHPDPGPEGVDVRERVKKVDSMLANQAAFDATHPPLASDAPATESVPVADVGSAGSLGAVAARNWPCVGTGSDGARVRMMYVYPSNTTSQMNSTFKSSLDTIARRMNNVFYNSSAGDGGSSRQLRFLTSAPSSGACSLYVSSLSLPVASYNPGSYSSIVSFLKAKGYTSNNMKYIVWMGYNASCGYGGLWNDNTKGYSNANNTLTEYAVIWKPCWNYGEPHELMHTLGGVIKNYADGAGTIHPGPPHQTANYHCWDQHDIMCYDDDVNASTYPLKIYCSTSYIWHYDCQHNDYFSSGVISSTNYLYSHWNVATSRFLYPNAQ